MATPSEKLAESLEILHGLQNANGAAAIRARDITRTHRSACLSTASCKKSSKAGTSRAAWTR